LLACVGVCARVCSCLVGLVGLVSMGCLTARGRRGRQALSSCRSSGAVAVGVVQYCVEGEREMGKVVVVLKKESGKVVEVGGGGRRWEERIYSVRALGEGVIAYESIWSVPKSHSLTCAGGRSMGK
jgi:hypothetical protein